MYNTSTDQLLLNWIDYSPLYTKIEQKLHIVPTRIITWQATNKILIELLTNISCYVCLYREKSFKIIYTIDTDKKNIKERMFASVHIF